jgi:alkaline phosphatase
VPNSGDHTNSLVPLFAKGVGANLLNKAADQHDLVRGRYLDNTELGRIQFDLLK